MNFITRFCLPTTVLLSKGSIVPPVVLVGVVVPLPDVLTEVDPIENLGRSRGTTGGGVRNPVDSISGGVSINPGIIRDAEVVAELITDLPAKLVPVVLELGPGYGNGKEGAFIGVRSTGEGRGHSGTGNLNESMGLEEGPSPRIFGVEFHILRLSDLYPSFNQKTRSYSYIKTTFKSLELYSTLTENLFSRFDTKFLPFQGTGSLQSANGNHLK